MGGLKPPHDRGGTRYSQIAVVAPVVFMVSSVGESLGRSTNQEGDAALHGGKAAVGFDLDCTN